MFPFILSFLILLLHLGCKKNEENTFNYSLHPEYYKVHKKYIKDEIPIIYYIKAMIFYLKSLNILKLKIVYPKVEKNFSNASSNILRFYHKNFVEVKKKQITTNETLINETFFNNRNKFNDLEYDIFPVVDHSNPQHSHIHLDEVFLNNIYIKKKFFSLFVFILK